MKNINILIVICVSFLAFSHSVFASEYTAQIKKISDLYDNMDYEKCLEEIRELEKYKSNMKKDDLIEVYKYKAFIYILSDRNALAENVIRDIYTLDPDFTLSPSISPKLREPFAKIKDEIKKGDKVTDSNAKIIEATPVDNRPQPASTTIEKRLDSKEEEGFFKENVIPISLVGGGLALFVPGLIIRLNAASDASDYRERLEKAPRDEIGNIIGISKDEAESRQEDINKKVLFGNSMIALGSVAMVSGLITYFVLPQIGKKEKSRAFVTYDGESFLVINSIDF